jgi:heat shock protein HtpX
MDIGFLKLRFAMLGTLMLIIGASTLFLAIILSFIRYLNLFTLLTLVIGFNILQWLMAPYIIDRMYGVKEVSPREAPKLHRIVERLSRKSGIKKPRLMIASLPIPNAFAYGSPIAGTRVAVTRGLLEVLEEEEVEAVIGHELGHLKHRDVQIMMFASVLPAIFYYLGYMMMWGGMFSRRDRDSGTMLIIGILSLLIYFILNLLVLGLSRLREYYADRHSALTVEDGARKLSEALAKLHAYSRRYVLKKPQTRTMAGFKALFIADPDVYVEELGRLSDEELVRRISSRRLSTTDRLMEIFSTHPNVVKRIKALQALRGVTVHER